MLNFDEQQFCFFRSGRPLASPEISGLHDSSRAWHFPPGLTLTKEPVIDVDFRREFASLGLSTLEIGGRRVLNVGCREGFFAHYALSCGAKSVLALEDAPQDLAPSQRCKELASQIGQELAHAYINLESENIKAIHGQFDVVIASDVLTHYEDPFSVLKQICASCSDRLWLLCHTRFEDDDLPRTYLYRNYDIEPHYRHRSVPNPAWLVNALDILGFQVLSGNFILEGKYVALHARRDTTRLQRSPLAYKDLPTDHEHEKKTVVLCMSCKKYETAWDPFFILFKRYWPDCPYKVYFGTDIGRYPGVETIEIGRDLGWANNCRYVLEKIDADRVILIFEDFLIKGRVDTERVRKYVQHSRDFNVGCVRLIACPGSSGTWYGTDCLGSIGPTDEYRVSMQVAIWAKPLLMKILRDGWNAWQTELEGTRYAAVRPEPFLSVKPSDPPVIDYFVTAITKGVWEDEAFALLDKEGIPRQHIPKRV